MEPSWTAWRSSLHRAAERPASPLGILFCIFVCGITPLYSQLQPLAGFAASPWFGEQILEEQILPDVVVRINAPAPPQFVRQKPVELVLYALPNGNTIDQTVGKLLQEGDDWHFDIQHIGAQTRWLREQQSDRTLVVAYLYATQRSWPAWKAAHDDYRDKTRFIIETILRHFEAYEVHLVLSGHSGGGRFVFSCLDAYSELPSSIRRICFLDSDYGYETSYGQQMLEWLVGSPDHSLCVLAYNDSLALYQGKPFVSATGGTWYRSRMFQKELAEFLVFETREEGNLIRQRALEGRVAFLLRKNPKREILHTVQVERNGFIHSLLSGTDLSELQYRYLGERVYEEWIQADVYSPESLRKP